MSTIVETSNKELLIEQLEFISKDVGNTPVFDFSDLIKNSNVNVFGKLEWKQLGGSIKARAALGILRSAIETGKLNTKKIFLDASSGNTGIAYAHITQQLGIETVIVLPENASQKRKDILTSLGVKTIFSSPFEGTDGAQELAKRLSEEFPEKYFYADQYNNDANWLQHYKTTGPEIWKHTYGEVTHFAASLGTTGTFIGVGRFLKDKNPSIKLIQMQPDSPMHGLEGWKHLETAKVPGIFDFRLEDENMSINSSEALNLIPKVIEKYDLRLSPSAAASLLGALKIAAKIERGTVVTTLADDGSKYEEVYNELKID